MNRARIYLRVAEKVVYRNRHRSVFAIRTYLNNATIASNTSPILIKPISRFCSSITEQESSLDSVTYDRVCTQTLDALYDYIEELTENATDLAGSDVAYGDGVLTVNLGPANGIYVINRQTPNKQIWLSSPTSGPKRFDYVSGGTDAGEWIYKHSGESLHQLLQLELGKIFKGQSVDFLQLPHSHN
ncbi:frataxin homolog, mitochondrial [Drosophila grimshawi]|uniref:ferroxidase n=1 Tax=Drosophila grimshawi TaxID=7222 RepID=B4JJB0_DROGR|nr:frataxin homolog, mitochondrial [Drosophila grimshawi]EDV99662.1 GH12457 [Drosophila grimshawi]